MLRLDINPQVWVKHDTTGCRFKIKPLDPRTNEKLQAAARNDKGEFDPIVFNGLVVDAVVLEWDGVGVAAGVAPLSADNKRKLGEQFPAISGFLFVKATDVRMFLDEVEAAKNA